MTKAEIEEIRADACQVVLMRVVDNLGFKHGRQYTSNNIIKAMEEIREELFGTLNHDHGLSKENFSIVEQCMNNVLAMFEGILLFKEGAHAVDLMYIGLRSQIKKGGVTDGNR